MSTFFLSLAAGLAVTNWFAVARHERRLEFFAKPATMLALIAYVVIRIAEDGPYRPASSGLELGILPFVLGLIFSLAGDVFLMLPKDRFLPGLVAFLLAHIAYIVGFNPIPPLKMPHILVAGLVVLLVALPTAQIYRRLAAALTASGRAALCLPVLIYTSAISLMMISAMFTLLRNGWHPFYSVGAAAGAASFLLSDTILAWDRFAAPIPRARLWTMMTYHLGQFLIAIAATLQYLTNP